MRKENKGTSTSQEQKQVQNKNKQKNNTSQSDTPAGRRISFHGRKVISPSILVIRPSPSCQSERALSAAQGGEKLSVFTAGLGTSFASYGLGPEAHQIA